MPNLSFGTVLQLGTNTIAGLQEIQGLEIKNNAVEVTSLTSPQMYKEFIGGFKEVSDLTVSGFFQPDDASGQMQMWSLLNNGAVQSFTILFPFGVSWTFGAIVTGFKTGAKTEDAVPFDGTLKITGAPALNTQASSGLSALSTTAGTLTPSFVANVYEYNTTATTSTVTVTPTATGTITVNGQGVTSGTASQSIPVGSSAITNITVTETDSGKVAKTYTIHVYRA